MRILFLTAGAAGMYCGSCFRDNALAAELKARGHDVLLLPLYTPTRTDEPNVSQDRVFFGGVSVYLQQQSRVFRRSPWLLDRLWDSPSIIRFLSGRGVTNDPRLLGDLTISMLRGEHGFQRKEFEKLLHWLAGEVTPDVVNLPNSLLIGLARPLSQALKRPVCCTLQGEDVFLRQLPDAYREAALTLIRENIPFVDRFIAVSEYCAAFMADYLSIPADRIDVVPLGINFVGYDPRTRGERAPYTVGYFARIAPEKGLHLLADAYIRFRRRTNAPDGRLEAGGYLAADQRGYLGDVQRILDRAGLGSELQYRGALDRPQKIAFLQNVDAFSVPCPYAEPKGLFVLEAMACGVPVVGPRHGAIPELLEKTGGGVLVEPGDAESLAEGLGSLWANRELAAEVGRRGFDGVRRHYSIAGSADLVLRTYEGLLGAGPAVSGSQVAAAG